RELPILPVEAVVLAGRGVEGADLVGLIRGRQRKLRGKWGGFAILYRQHFHRERGAAELAGAGGPFSIDGMDVMDTPEVRDLFACAGAIVSSGHGASLLRVATLPQFTIDPEELRTRIRAIPRAAESSAIAAALSQVQEGPAVLQALERVREEIANANAKSSV